MRKVQCGECGRRYDFDIDDFCPKCGAFNQPAQSWRIDRNGSVVRVDGINEENHRGSFVHRELHAEDRERRRVGLERNAFRTGQPARPAEQGTSQRDRKKTKMPLIGWIILTIIGINVFFNLLRGLLTLLLW